MTDSHDSNDSCIICFESLFSQSVGACVPCGHVFHQVCWDGWYASQQRNRNANDSRRGRGQGRGQCKCPMCNQPSSQFVRLFLDRIGSDGVSAQVSLDDSVTDGDDDNATDEKCRAWKEKVQRLRAIYETARSNLSKQTDELRKTRDQIEKLHARVEQRELDLEGQRHVQEQQARALEEKRLSLVQAERERDTCKHAAETAQDAAAAAESELHRVRRDYHDAVHKASALDMEEVKTLQRDYPKLQKENRDLQEKNRALHKRLGTLVREKQKLVRTANRLSKSSTTRITVGANPSANKQRKRLLNEVGGTDRTTTTTTRTSQTDRSENDDPASGSLSGSSKRKRDAVKDPMAILDMPSASRQQTKPRFGGGVKDNNIANRSIFMTLKKKKR